MPYVKNSISTEYEFAVLLLHSKYKHIKQTRHEMLKTDHSQSINDFG